MATIITQVPPTEIVQAGAASSTAKPATEIPLIESGDGDVGLSLKYAREDHVHPASVPVTPPLVVLRSYLAGLKLTWVSGTEFSVAAGQAADNANAIMMNLPAVISKTTSNWVAGNGGGLDTGSGIGAAVWYHVFLIRNPTTSVVDVVYSATGTPEVGPTTLPSGFTQWRRIGSVKTLASQFVAFAQRGDEFLWNVPPLDVNGSTGTTGVRTMYTMTVPQDVLVHALIRLQISSSVAGAGVVITSPDVADLVANYGAGTGAGLSIRSTAAVAADSLAAHFSTPTDMSGRIAIRANNSLTFLLMTFGWIDRRGRDN